MGDDNTFLSRNTLRETPSRFQIPAVIRRYRNFAPFVRQTGEKKAQTCDMEIYHQLGGTTALIYGNCSVSGRKLFAHACKRESLFPVKLLGNAGRQVLQVAQKRNHLPDFVVAQ